MNEGNNIVDDEEAFHSLLKEAFQTIIQSDIHGEGSSSQGRWLHDPAARRLKALIDRLVIHVSFGVVADIVRQVLLQPSVPSVSYGISASHIVLSITRQIIHCVNPAARRCDQ